MTFRRMAVVVLVSITLWVCGPTRAEETLSIWWERSGLKAQDDALAGAIQRFESRYRVKVALTLLATQEVVPRLVDALAAGRPPDIGFGNLLDLQSTARWAHDGKLEDISSVIDPIRNRFDPAALATVFLYDGVRQNRAYYAFPLQQQTMRIQYWKDMLTDAGLKESDIPLSWDGYWDFWCSTVQQAYRKKAGSRVYGVGLPMGVDSSASTWGFLTFLDATNVRLVDDVGRLLIDEPAVRAGLVKAMTRYTRPYLDGCVPPSSTSWQDADNDVTFQNRTTVLAPTTSLSMVVTSLDDMSNPLRSAAQRAAASESLDAAIATAAFPRKPDGRAMVYRTSVKTGVIFNQANNKRDARRFVAFLLEDAQLTPYVEGGLGRGFPVMRAAQQRPFWKADPARLAVYQQYMRGTVPFEFTRNYRFTTLNHENVWAKAMHRIVTDKVPVEQAVDEMVARIKAVAGP